MSDERAPGGQSSWAISGRGMKAIPGTPGCREPYDRPETPGQKRKEP